MFKKISSWFLIVFLICPYIYSIPPAKPTSDEQQTDSLDNTKIDWWLVRAKDHQIPRFNTKLPFKLEDYDALCVGDTTRKVVYLTFDEGYEKGYTPLILDTLKKYNVKATFFVTGPYITSSSDIIKRMADEGHIVGNHTMHHPSMPKLTSNKEKFDKEFMSVSDRYKEVTRQDMPLYFRPPMGHYSQKSLAMTKALGYKTIFWSFAYCDWDPQKQPNPSKAKDIMLGGLHNGAVYLLHAVSKTNAQVLGDFISESQDMGYTFELLP